MLREAVDRTISKFGRVDFVICGQFLNDFKSQLLANDYTGAAGNFLASISAMSENAFKSVMEIDTVRATLFFLLWRLNLDCSIPKVGTFNTIKATLPYVRKSRGAYIHVSATLHYLGMCS